MEPGEHFRSQALVLDRQPSGRSELPLQLLTLHGVWLVQEDCDGPPGTNERRRGAPIEGESRVIDA